jgi:hypothetical protein
MLPERTLDIGDAVEMYGKSHEVRGAMLVEGGPERMLLVVPEGSAPHPFDWMPESSVLRLAIRPGAAA